MEEMSLCKIYRAMLEAVRLKVTQNGAISIMGLNDYEPLTIEQKRLVIPEDDQMNVPDWSNRMLFHPLQENISIVESQPQLVYRQIAFYQIGTMIAALLKVLMEYAANPAKHKDLTPQQSEYLSIPDFKPDGKTYEELENLFKKIRAMPPSEQKKYWINGFIRRKARFNNQEYSRLCSVDFPFYDKLVAALPGNKHSIDGVSFRKKDVLAIKSLLEYILPGIQNKDEFSNPSNSRQAPTTDALMGSLKLLMSRLNDTIETFIPITLETDRFNLDWVPAFAEIDALIPVIRRIPQISSSTLPATTTTDTTSAAAIVSSIQTPAAPAPAPQPQPQPQVVAQPQPVQNMPVANNQPAAPSNGIYTLHGAGIPMVPNQPLPVVKTPDGKIDLAATQQARMQASMGLQANPFVQNTNPLMPQPMVQQPQVVIQGNMGMIQQPPPINLNGMMINPVAMNNAWYYPINNQYVPAQQVLQQMQMQMGGVQQMQNNQLLSLTNGAVPLSAIQPNQGTMPMMGGLPQPVTNNAFSGYI